MPDDFQLLVELLSNVRPQCTYLPGTTGYQRALMGYWAYEQRHSRPGCIFQPHTAGDVSLAMIVLRQTKIPFAIKAGGHGKFFGESSITDGLLVDLKLLNHVTVSDDKQTVDVGPGNCWLEVYTALEPQGLAVVGGRASSVGVGGFLLGGGISYFSNMYGWATDNIKSFDVVLSNGSIVTASQDQHADLYKCLRGGAANCGIVVSFKLDAVPNLTFWGGGIGWDLSLKHDVFESFLDYGYNNDLNRNMSFILGLNHHVGHGWLIGGDVMSLGGKIPEKEPVWRELLSIEKLADFTRLGAQSEHIGEMIKGYPLHVHNCFWTFCTQIDARIIDFYFTTWIEEAEKIRDVAGIEDHLLADCQFITQNVVDAMSRRGGNILGLAGTGPFLMMLIQPNWTDGAQSTRVYRAIQNTVERVTKEADRLGLAHQYQYSNYSSQWQDPIASYGAESNELLRKVSTKYDPDGIFQKQRTSGFNLNGPLAVHDSKPTTNGKLH